MQAGRLLTFGAAVMLGAVALLAWALSPAATAGPCAVAAGPALLPDLPEASGLAVSRRHPGVVWSHNDSGSAAVLFALDATGAPRGRVALPIRTRDWEDVSAAPCPPHDCLYIADIGDNERRRDRIRIHRLPEPALSDTMTAPPETFDAAYADGPHNAEAMFVVGADLFIVTRDRAGGVYRATLSGGRELTFRRIGQLGLAAVTDAEASRDGASVVVRTSHEAVLYRTGDLVLGRTAPQMRIPIDGLRELQGEGVALDGSTLYLASEGKPWSRAGRLVNLSCRLPQ